MAAEKLQWKDGIGYNPRTKRYVVTWHAGGRHMHRRDKDSGEPFTSRRQAKEYKVDREREQVRKGRSVETVESLCARYAKDYCKAKRETTRIWYEERLTRFAEDFHGRRLSSVTRSEAYEWARENPNRAKAVRAMFSTATELEIDGLTTNPFRGLGLAQGKGRGGVKMLTEGELDLLVSTARDSHRSYGDHFAAAVQTLAWTGMRPGELYGLEWQDVDWERGRLHIRRQYVSKTDSLEEYTKMGADEDPGRQVPLFPVVAEALRGIERVEGEPYVFHTPSGLRFAAWTFRNVWTPVRDSFTAKLHKEHWLRRRVRDKGNVGKLDAYELRHLYGTILARQGVSPYSIAKLMGHRDGGRLAMKLYIHTENDEAIDEVRRLFLTDTADPAVSTR